MNENIIYYTIIFIYGIVIGSFLNVCIYRIPERVSIVTGRSHCTNCNTQIRWYDLIPVLSYLFLLGRCRKCKSKISIQYPIIEALNGFLYVLVFFLSDFSTVKNVIIRSAYCLVISALLVLSVIDLRTKTIPLGINIFIAFMGVVIATVKYFMDRRDISIIIDHAIGLFSVSLFLLFIYILTHGRGIGGGDIKLMGAAGLVLGGSLVVLAFLLGCVLAAIIHPIRMKISKLNRVLEFGPYLSAGIVISMLFGRQIIDWYIQAFFY